MKTAALIAAALLALAATSTASAKALGPEDGHAFNVHFCSLAPNAEACADKLDECVPRRQDLAYAASPSANVGMAIYYGCLEEQNVPIPGVDE